MNITLHQLNVLRTISEQGSLTLAAQVLHITQPAVSNIVKQLESKCRYPLTETLGKKIFLTQAGQRLVKAAVDIQHILEQTAMDLDDQHDHLSGTMTVAIVSTAKYFMPRLLGEFRKKYPLIKIKLTVCNRQEAIHILKNNTSDFLVMSHPPDDMIVNQQVFYHDQLVVAASPEIKLTKKVKKLTDLSDQEWVTREEGSGTRIVMQRLFKKHKMQPNIAMEVSSNESIKQLIMANMGISIISKQSIELELKHDLLSILSIQGFPMNHPWYFVMNEGKHIHPISQTFFEFVRQQDFQLLS